MQLRLALLFSVYCVSGNLHASGLANPDSVADCQDQIKRCIANCTQSIEYLTQEAQEKASLTDYAAACKKAVVACTDFIATGKNILNTFDNKFNVDFEKFSRALRCVFVDKEKADVAREAAQTIWEHYPPASVSRERLPDPRKSSGFASSANGASVRPSPAPTSTSIPASTSHKEPSISTTSIPISAQAPTSTLQPSSPKHTDSAVGFLDNRWNQAGLVLVGGWAVGSIWYHRDMINSWGDTIKGWGKSRWQTNIIEKSAEKISTEQEQEKALEKKEKEKENSVKDLLASGTTIIATSTPTPTYWENNRTYVAASVVTGVGALCCFAMAGKQ